MPLGTLTLPSHVDQTGSPEATKAIIVFHDIFGYTPQTLQVGICYRSANVEQSTNNKLQGTDLLAKTSGYLVFVPDFFHGKPAERDWYPPDSPEKMEKLGAWVQVQEPPEKSAEVIWGLVKALTQRSAGKIEKWGGLGMCFGARVRDSFGLNTIFLDPGCLQCLADLSCCAPWYPFGSYRAYIAIHARFG